MQYCQEVFCAKYQHSKHLATSCHFNLKERQSFWPRDTLFGKEHLINMLIRNNFGFVLAQRITSQNLSRIDWVSNFLWIFKEFHPILCLDPCHKRLECELWKAAIDHLFRSLPSCYLSMSPYFQHLSKNHRMDKRKSFYLPDSIEIGSLEGLTLWCPEINESKRLLAWWRTIFMAWRQWPSTVLQTLLISDLKLQR